MQFRACDRMIMQMQKDRARDASNTFTRLTSHYTGFRPTFTVRKNPNTETVGDERNERLTIPPSQPSPAPGAALTKTP